jgi:hypothetical protein
VHVRPHRDERSLEPRDRLHHQEVEIDLDVVEIRRDDGGIPMRGVFKAFTNDGVMQ